MMSKVVNRRLILPMILLISACFAAGDDSGLGSLDVDGVERSYRIFVPDNLPLDQPVPLLLLFHGGGGNADYGETHSMMDQVATEQGFIVVYPNGTSQRLAKRMRTWNAGNCCGKAYKDDVDDVKFTEALIDRVARDYNIDQQRIYATGMSNGGMMVYRLACEIPQRFAAVVVVSGARTFDNCHPSTAIPILHIHGTEDTNVPPEGGIGKKSFTRVDYLSVRESLEPWRQKNDCDFQPETERQDAVEVMNEYHCKNAPVEFLQLQGGGHEWALGGDGEVARLALSRRIWEFFKGNSSALHR